MINVVSRLFAAVVLCALLVGCSISSDSKATESLPAQIVTAGQGLIAARRAPPPQTVVATRALLAKITEPVLQINPEAAGGSDFLRRAVSRRDSSTGTVEVWNSSVLAQVFLRNGVVVGTRGVGGDIIAADANMTILALRSRADRSGQRVYTISDGDATSTEYVFRCTVRSLGQENIIVAEQLFATTHMQENCTGGPSGDATIRNDYWVQPSNDVVRRSRQWVGPTTGYFELILLRD